MGRRGPYSDVVVVRNLWNSRSKKYWDPYEALVNQKLDYVPLGDHYSLWVRVGLLLNNIDYVKDIPKPGRLYALLFNPAPVYVKTYRGELTKEQVAEIENVSVRAITYYRAEGGETYVEFGAYPGRGINPFAFAGVRYAVNYLVDRDHYVDLIMPETGVPVYTLPSMGSRIYYNLLGDLIQYYFPVSPRKAFELINETLSSVGAELVNGTWYYDGEPINITIVALSTASSWPIAVQVSNALRMMGFNVTVIAGYPEEIRPILHSCPEEHKWHIYVEPNGQTDEALLWYTMRPGQPYYGCFRGGGWVYKNDTIEHLIVRLLRGRYHNMTEYSGLYARLVDLLRRDSLRVFVAQENYYYFYLRNLSGVLPEPGNPYYTMRLFHKDENGSLPVRVAITEYYHPVLNSFRMQASMAGLLLTATHDPPVIVSGMTGDVEPFRADVRVLIPKDGYLYTPPGTIMWSTFQHKWVSAAGRNASFVIKLNMSNYIGYKWHNNMNITWGDVLASIAGWTEIMKNSAIRSQETILMIPGEPFNFNFINSIVGIRIIEDNNTLELYINKSVWNTLVDFNATKFIPRGFLLVNPAEIIYLQYYLSYVKNVTALSEARASQYNLTLMKLVDIDEELHDIIVEGLQDLTNESNYPEEWFYVGNKTYMTLEEWSERINADLQWLEDHAITSPSGTKTYNLWISNGPYILEAYRFDPPYIFKLRAFRSEGYPFTVGDWINMSKQYEGCKVEIVNVDIAPIVPGANASFTIKTWGGCGNLKAAYMLRYPPSGEIVSTGLLEPVEPGVYKIDLDSNMTSMLDKSKVYELFFVIKSDRFYMPAYESAPIPVLPAYFNKTKIGYLTVFNITRDTYNITLEIYTTREVMLNIALYDLLNMTEVESPTQMLGYAMDLYFNDTESIVWPIYITITYNESSLPPGFNESNLTIYYYNRTTGKWEPCSDVKIDPENNTIRANFTLREYLAGIGNVFSLGERPPWMPPQREETNHSNPPEQTTTTTTTTSTSPPATTSTETTPQPTPKPTTQTQTGTHENRTTSPLQPEPEHKKRSNTVYITYLLVAVLLGSVLLIVYKYKH